MNKLCKILSVIALTIIVISVSITAQAYTNNDVIAYISKAHTVNGRTVQLSYSQRQSLRKYLKSNPVSDADANEIIAKLDEAKAKISNSGATNLSELSESTKAEIVALVKEAGAIAGLDVQIDTVNEVVTVKDKDGNIIISATSYASLNGSSKSNVGTGSSSTATSTASGNGATTGSTTTGKKLVYTGSDYSGLTQTIVAIVAIAITGMVVKSKYAK